MPADTLWQWPPHPAVRRKKTANGVLSIEPEDYGSPTSLPSHQWLDDKRSNFRLDTSCTPRGVMRLRYLLIVGIVITVESLMMPWWRKMCKSQDFLSRVAEVTFPLVRISSPIGIRCVCTSTSPSSSGESLICFDEFSYAFIFALYKAE